MNGKLEFGTFVQKGNTFLEAESLEHFFANFPDEEFVYYYPPQSNVTYEELHDKHDLNLFWDVAVITKHDNYHLIFRFNSNQDLFNNLDVLKTIAESENHLAIYRREDAIQWEEVVPAPIIEGTPVKAKFFEVRDSMTMMPIMVTEIKLTGNKAEDWLMWKVGLGRPESGCYRFLVTELQTGESHYEPHDWRPNTTIRTMREAHSYIEEHYDQLETGAVIDVQFILGEKPEPKISERLDK